MTPNKEKKECCEMCYKWNDTAERRSCSVCPCHSEKQECKLCDGNYRDQFGKCEHDYTSDPLTSLLQSASKEFEEKFIKTSMWELVPNTPRKIMMNDKDVAVLMVDIQSFLLSKLTEAFNKGKQFILERNDEVSNL